MSSEKKLRIALIISVCLLILGGALLTVATFFGFLKPLAYTLLIFGAIATFITFFWWTFHL